MRRYPRVRKAFSPIAQNTPLWAGRARRQGHPAFRIVSIKITTPSGVVILKPDFNLDIFDISEVTSQFLKDATRRSIVADRCRKSKCLFGVLFLFFG